MSPWLTSELTWPRPLVPTPMKPTLIRSFAGAERATRAMMLGPAKKVAAMAWLNRRRERLVVMAIYSEGKTPTRREQPVGEHCKPPRPSHESRHHRYVNSLDV